MVRGRWSNARLAVWSRARACLRLTQHRLDHAQPRRIDSDVVRRQDHAHETTASFENGQCVPSPPGVGRQPVVEHTHQLDIAVPQPDQPVESSVSEVPTARRGAQADGSFNVGGRLVWVRACDKDMVDTGEHRRQRSGAPASWRLRLVLRKANLHAHRHEAVRQVAQGTAQLPQSRSPRLAESEEVLPQASNRVT